MMHKTKTTDIYIAAYIMNNGGILLNHDINYRDQIEFELEAANMKDILNKYYNGTGVVPARKNKTTILELKDMIFSNSRR